MFFTLKSVFLIIYTTLKKITDSQEQRQQQTRHIQQESPQYNNTFGVLLTMYLFTQINSDTEY